MPPITRSLRRLTSTRSSNRPDGDGSKRVAIACQGGGSHTAFTAGVLEHLLSNLDSRYHVSGLSGASGGAVCATAAWYGLMDESRNPGSVLDAIWTDIAAESLWDRWMNAVALVNDAFDGGTAMSKAWVKGSSAPRRRLTDILSAHIDFDSFDRLANARASAPSLLVGAVDVDGGEHVCFQDGDVTVDSVLASAAIPPLFNPVTIDGVPYLDGVFSENPPIWNFLVDEDADESVDHPDELWVVKINPDGARFGPTASTDTETRVRQLVGDLSLSHQLRFVDTLHEFSDRGLLHDRFDPPETKIIQLPAEAAASISKLDRSAQTVARLREVGETEARAFLADEAA
ncbi:patatin-like phospholipase family protein [Haloarchaeobius sp. HRN-SO-5]|uniref:patatin-like phospholipase family protein n=1 Tax=Haloarchaeobius sp. HRN-SO-5 TaxID=3446118 RepID=UPI003EB84162